VPNSNGALSSSQRQLETPVVPPSPDRSLIAVRRQPACSRCPPGQGISLCGIGVLTPGCACLTSIGYCSWSPTLSTLRSASARARRSAGSLCRDAALVQPRTATNRAAGASPSSTTCRGLDQGQRRRPVFRTAPRRHSVCDSWSGRTATGRRSPTRYRPRSPAGSGSASIQP